MDRLSLFNLPKNFSLENIEENKKKITENKKIEIPIKQENLYEKNICDKKCECKSNIDCYIKTKDIKVVDKADAIAYIFAQNNVTGFFIKRNSKKYIITTTDFVVDTNTGQVPPTLSAAIINLNGVKGENKYVPLKLVGFDGNTNVCVLIIDEDIDSTQQNYFKYRKLEDYENGQFVYSINWNEGIFASVNSGIISNKNFVNSDIINLESISTTLAFDNSVRYRGTPVLDENKNVISMLMTNNLANSFSYGIEENLLRHVSYSIIDTNSNYVKGYAGLVVATLTQVGYDIFTSGQIIGMAVVFSIPGAPAQMAGIQDDDIILSVDGFKIGELYHAVCSITYKKKPGDTIQVIYMRNNVINTTNITLIDFPNMYNFPFSFFL